MKNILIKALLIFAGLTILLTILLYFYWGVFSSSNWGKYYFKKMPWEQLISDPASHKKPLIAFVVIFVIAIVLVIIDEIRLSRKNRNQMEPYKSFISTSSPNTYLLYAIYSGLVSVLEILFIIIPFLHEGDFSLQNIKENAFYFINIILIVLAFIYFSKKYIRLKHAIEPTSFPKK